MPGRRKKEFQDKMQQEAAEREQRKATERVNNIKKYGQEYGNLINNGKVAVGMTQEMCRAALGSPRYSYSSETKAGKETVWIYGLHTALTFQNNKLIEIEELKY